MDTMARAADFDLSMCICAESIEADCAGCGRSHGRPLGRFGLSTGESNLVWVKDASCGCVGLVVCV